VAVEAPAWGVLRPGDASGRGAVRAATGRIQRRSIPVDQSARRILIGDWCGGHDSTVLSPVPFAREVRGPVLGV
jgi:hypothetical protein